MSAEKDMRSVVILGDGEEPLVDALSKAELPGWDFESNGDKATGTPQFSRGEVKIRLHVQNEFSATTSNVAPFDGAVDQAGAKSALKDLADALGAAGFAAYVTASDRDLV
ncbi:TPA: hypothetical protein UM350_001347 [Stenotrophomonas maltophilia]|uniref:hypothetical protein n=1 Tax=Stenotrophomonas TaxID=40323 RepID=UPI0013DD1670|nr:MULTISPECIES: hypothetical protein [Stenotrophomonas]MBH1562733.1 hypothetical protein [Stenotrophomonas maltophilia]MBH1642581.1 hypothetical protein [Stenotrophomonas maltophilia]MBN4978343.1 hypothetical protein [Stenotrophomonas maltophilia]MBN5120542.1 hypothetical protein [Stenotrophomonas maltophilia]MBO3005550.1 hypothetical protein [Stenotrophomonas maltophilia]